MATVDVNHPPAGGFQNGGWYWDPSAGAARQFNTQTGFGPPGVINNPEQQGYGQAVDPASQGGNGDGGFNTSSGNPADDYIQSILDSVTRPALEAAQRSKEFDEKNPFRFDEAQARASASERFDPYYKAELGDYLSGVERKRQATVQDEESLRKELVEQTATTTEQTKNALEKAVRNSEQGFASSGLFNSGERMAATGEQEVDTNANLAEFIRKQQLQSDQSTLRQGRALTELGANSRTFQRQLGAEKETNILTDVESQRQDAQRRREFERQNYVGYPLAGGTGSLSSIYGIG